jgi:hypothetical protein
VLLRQLAFPGQYASESTAIFRESITRSFNFGSDREQGIRTVFSPVESALTKFTGSFITAIVH